MKEKVGSVVVLKVPENWTVYWVISLPLSGGGVQEIFTAVSPCSTGKNSTTWPGTSEEWSGVEGRGGEGRGGEGRGGEGVHCQSLYTNVLFAVLTNDAERQVR